MKLRTRGKFLFASADKFYLKGAAIHSPIGDLSPFKLMGANTIWHKDTSLENLDLLVRKGLFSVISLGIEEAFQMAFAGKRNALKDWHEGLEARLSPVRGNPAVLAYSLGGPIAEPIRRWFGYKCLERELQNAWNEVKRISNGCPITFTNDVSCESLELAFLDFFSFEVNEPSLGLFGVTLARLQKRAGDYPLVVLAPGRDTLGASEKEQAHLVTERIRLAFTAGCAGVLITGANKGDLAWDAIRDAFAQSPFPLSAYPRISVVICVYNGEDLIEEALDGVSQLDYPDYEVIVVDDGSKDRTFERIGKKGDERGYRVIRLPKNRGLSNARNVGMRAATGEIIAYLDHDASPDKHWLRYLALTFLSSKHAVVGGPNINPLSSNWIADCVNQVPGNPQIVMIDDELADHIPGCNLAVRRSFLEAMGGFNLDYPGAGDDVDFCWRVQKLGGTLGVSAGAMVWHHRRGSIKGFLKQQKSYGGGEAVLEKDWPQRFNSLGHQSKAGASEAQPAVLRPRIYQAISGPPSSFLKWIGMLSDMPEWSLIVLILGGLSSIGLRLPSFNVFTLFFLAAVFFWGAQGVIASRLARLRNRTALGRLVTGFLFVTQPIARLSGRMGRGLTPWRSRCTNGFVIPRARVFKLAFSEGLSSHNRAIGWKRALKEANLPIVQGGADSRWAWQIEGGLFGGVRFLIHHDLTDSFVRAWPYVGKLAWFSMIFASLPITLCVYERARMLGALFCMGLFFPAVLALRQMGQSTATLEQVITDKRWKVSLWENFQPARHIREILSLPTNHSPGVVETVPAKI